MATAIITLAMPLPNTATTAIASKIPEGKQHIANAHDQPIPPAFIISSQQAQQRPDRRTDKHGKHSRRQRDLRTNRDTAENVAPQ